MFYLLVFCLCFWKIYGDLFLVLLIDEIVFGDFFNSFLNKLGTYNFY